MFGYECYGRQVNDEPRVIFSHERGTTFGFSVRDFGKLRNSDVALCWPDGVVLFKLPGIGLKIV